MIEKRIIYLATIEGYRPSGFDKCNVVFGGNGLCPTITLAYAKANQPMVFVREEDEQMPRDCDP